MDERFECKKSRLPVIAALLIGASTLVYSFKGTEKQLDFSNYIPKEDVIEKDELIKKKEDLILEKNLNIIRLSSIIQEKNGMIASYQNTFQKVHDRYENDEAIIHAAGYSMPSGSGFNMNPSLHMYKKKITVKNKVYDCSFYEKSNGLVNILTLSNHEGTKKFICMDDKEVNILYITGEEILSPKPNGTIYTDRENSRNVTDTLVMAQEIYDETIEEIVAMKRGSL